MIDIYANAIWLGIRAQIYISRFHWILLDWIYFLLRDKTLEMLLITIVINNNSNSK
jgi:hypothetical protein